MKQESSGQRNAEQQNVLLNEDLSVTPAGYQRVREIFTDPEASIYGIYTNQENSDTIAAAAMARLSRSPNDLRVTWLKEFSDYETTNQDTIIKRIVSEYGDDSVQQLNGIRIVVEGASNILTKDIEWGRLAAYLEQSTRYIYFDQKDKQGLYKYIVPPELDDRPKLAGFYRQTMDQIFENYSHIVRTLTDEIRSQNPLAEGDARIPWQNATRAQACDVARELLPAATKSTVGIYASGQALENMIMRMMADELQEVRQAGQRILTEARKIIGVFLERADKPERGGAYSAYLSQTKSDMRRLVRDLVVPETGNYLELHSSNELAARPVESFIDHRNELPGVDLANYNFEDELDLVPYMIYEHVNHLSLADIQTMFYDAMLDRRDKIDIFKTYVGERFNRRHKPGRAFEQIQYSWDLVTDYGIFRDIQRHRIVSDLNWQLLTPYEGFKIHPKIEEFGLVDEWLQTFELSADLFKKLRREAGEFVAQYATLFGHYMRWKIAYNAREAFHIHELRTTPQGHPSYRNLVNRMHNKVAEVHPMTAGAMKFVNQDEDPALTRLAAEMYHQFKRSQV